MIVDAAIESASGPASAGEEEDVQSISNYENGQRWPQPDVFDLLGKALGVRPWKLLAGESEGGEIPPEVSELVTQLARACGLKVSRPS